MAVIGVAWIQETEAELDRKPPVVHIQSQDDETTLCGLLLDGMELDFWEDQGDEWPGCKRCARSYRNLK
jgi:hypothetical protein